LLFFGGAAFLILWKAGGNWFAWYTGFILLFYLTGGALNEINQVSQVMGGFYGAGGILWPLYLLYLYLFPNGRAVPKWTRWPMAAIIGLHALVMTGAILLSFGIGGRFESFGEGGFFVVILVGFPLILVSQVLRYRNDSTPVERQQTKWFVGSLALIVILGMIQTVLTGSMDLIEIGWWGDLSGLLDFLIPISLVISILRYRLWDIDVIIRRTLVYGVLTAVLALVFFGGVTLLQRLFQVVSGQQSAISIVLSTLAIAALFNPLRRRVQDFIDRRFYRKKYNAEQALARFAARAREETDIEQLSAEMVGVVEETMQPERVNLWLKPQERNR
jgi:hypothetical protein